MEVRKLSGDICAMDFNAMCVKPSSNSMFVTLWPDGGVGVFVMCLLPWMQFAHSVPRPLIGDRWSLPYTATLLFILFDINPKPSLINASCVKHFDCIALPSRNIQGDIYHTMKGQSFRWWFCWTWGACIIQWENTKPPFISNICHKYTSKYLVCAIANKKKNILICSTCMVP